MEFKEIQDLLRTINRYGLTEVEIERKDFKIKIRNKKDAEANVIYAAPQAAVAQPVAAVAQPAPVAQPQPAVPAPQAAAEPKSAAPADDNLITFRSPMIGTFYRSSSPEEAPFVEVGSEIKKGQAICIVEAMKLFNEIESEVSGKIVKVLAEDKQPVEYDQPLFLIDPA